MSNYPTVRPSLTLDFQKSKQLDPRISFSRSSTATYVEGGVIKTADEHQARFEEEGLLVEESRTNLFNQSEDLTTWTSNLYTKTNNQAISPDGTQTAGSLVPNVGTTSQSSGRTVTQSAGNYVCSVFAKPNGLTVLKIRFSGSSYQALFNLTGNGSVTLQSNGTASISKRPDGWYRCVFVINDSVGETAEWQIGQSNSNVDGTNGFYIWGMQVEAGSFPTSYIPTSGSTVTRAIDILQINADNFSSWYSPSQGSLLGEYVANGGFGPFRIWNGNGNNLNYWQIGAAAGAGGVMGLATRSNQGASTTNDWPGRIDADTNYGFKIKHAAGISVGGSSCYTFSSSGDSNLNTGGAANTANYVAPLVDRFAVYDLEGSINIARLSYYSERLTDTQLEAITL